MDRFGEEGFDSANAVLISMMSWDRKMIIELRLNEWFEEDSFQIFYNKVQADFDEECFAVNTFCRHCLIENQMLVCCQFWLLLVLILIRIWSVDYRNWLSVSFFCSFWIVFSFIVFFYIRFCVGNLQIYSKSICPLD